MPLLWGRRGPWRYRSAPSGGKRDKPGLGCSQRAKRKWPPLSCRAPASGRGAALAAGKVPGGGPGQGPSAVPRGAARAGRRPPSSRAPASPGRPPLPPPPGSRAGPAPAGQAALSPPPPSRGCNRCLPEQEARAAAQLPRARPASLRQARHPRTRLASPRGQ